jgi:hypothetical protein
MIVTFLFICGAASWMNAQEEPDPATMMAKMKQFTTPGNEHQLLESLIGEWDTETSVMNMPPTKGTAEFKWVLNKRFVEQNYSGEMMGQPYTGVGHIGYDVFKKKYVSSSLTSMETAIRYSEGLVDRTGKIISFYGTMDEYLTGEHDKAVKYVMNFVDPDHLDFEIHDLAIGEQSKVVAIKYTRKK